MTNANPHKSPTGHVLGRRTFAIAVAAGFASGAMVRPALADTLIAADNDWRRALFDAYFDPGADFTVRPLQDGLELFEIPSRGYMVVDTAKQSYIEYSIDAVSPYAEVRGELAYLGPTNYFLVQKNDAIDLFRGDLFHASAIRSEAREAANQYRDAVRRETSTQTDSAGISPMDLTPVKSSEVKSRVTSYTYITGSTLYPNTTGTCGWVAGSIITRYWHARSTARKLLPSDFRNGTNMTTSPNFATYLQGNSNNSSWALDLRDRLIWNAKKQGVGATSSWAVGSVGIVSAVRANKPVIAFGAFPGTDGKKKNHAVVCYGETTGGGLITHYGWAGYNNIVLTVGIMGSNTKFELT